MKTEAVEIRAKGKTVRVPSISIDGKTVVVLGKFLRMAVVRDEEWQTGWVENPDQVVARLKQDLKADIFSFAQKLPDTQPLYHYHFVWDNVAAIRITSYDDWWEKQLPQVTRKSVRRGIKRGVTAAVAEFNDELVRGIIEIHNDTPTRQGIPFYHYGKEFPVVKREYGTYPERSEFIGAYCQNELIGIIKMVYTGTSANIMQICTMTRHYDKRPTNILIAKAVEVCAQKRIPFLVYGKYIYGNKTDSSLTEFKRRNAFEKIELPRFYVPLTLKGTMAMKANLHLGLFGILPAGAINFLRDARAAYYRLKSGLTRGKGVAAEGNRSKEDPEDENR